MTLDAGTYNVTEDSVSGYSGSLSAGCTGTAVSDDNLTCTITNTYQPQADVAITKVADKESVQTGDSVTFTITVSNSGPDATGNVAVTDNLPAGLTYSGSDVTTGSLSCEAGSCTWTLSTLAGGASASSTITATVTTNQEGTLTNTATVSASLNSNTGNDSASASVAVVATPCTGNCGTPTTTPSSDLSITKTISNSAPNAGDTIKYTLIAHNAGPSDATSAVATDTLPSTITFVSASTTTGTFDATTSVWTIGNLANGADAVLEIIATVNSNTAGQSVSNSASVAALEADPDISNNASTAAGTVNTPAPGGCTSNCGGGGGGGGGGGTYTPPVPQILGTTTVVSIAMPPAEPQVLGASTTLPRTGLPGQETLAILLASLTGAYTVMRRKKI